MFDKLEDLLIRYEEIMSELSEPDVANNPERFRKLMKEQSSLTPIVEAYKEYKQCKQNIEDSLAMLEEESDEEMREMAKEELNDSKARVEELESQMKILLLPKDPNDDKNVIVEIRAGAGGDEAALFAAEIYRMYAHYAESRRWKVELMEADEIGIGGMKSVTFMVTGQGAYSVMKYESGVGRLPITVVHGMTLGEIARMANGEGWLKNGGKVSLKVVPCENYTHQTRYELPIAPSPNLRTMKAIYLYPSVCYFEATPVSLGRGTDFPFEVYGHPDMKNRDFEFTPRSVAGAKNPPQLDNLCHGVDLRNISDEEAIAQGINLEYVIDAYRDLDMGDKYFRNFFELLIGRGDIRQMIKDGKSAAEIKATWAGDVAKFREQRRPYLLYAE